MIGWPLRTFSFSRFALSEYIRSGRILVELLALVLVWYLFFSPSIVARIDRVQFFNVTGLFAPLLTAYTTAMVMSLGNRPQGYVVLGRALGRTGYLIGLYVAAVVVTMFIYLVLLAYVLIAVQSATQPAPFSPVEWMFGTLPLLLNVATVAAFTTLMTPLVISKGWRLIVLGLIVLGAGGLNANISSIGASSAGAALVGILALAGVVVLPVTSGYVLAAGGSFDRFAIEVMLGQLALTLALLALVLFAFCRRELIFRS